MHTSFQNVKLLRLPHRAKRGTRTTGYRIPTSMPSYLELGQVRLQRLDACCVYQSRVAVRAHSRNLDS